MDEDGYPTDEVLEAIRQWPYTDANGCLEYVAGLWHWPDFASRELPPHEAEVVHADDGDRYLRLATGGWSGNESLISAMKENVMLRSMCWCLSARGGLHIWLFMPEPKSDKP
jgi:hypothetical protein